MPRKLFTSKFLVTKFLSVYIHSLVTDNCPGPIRDRERIISMKVCCQIRFKLCCSPKKKDFQSDLQSKAIISDEQFSVFSRLFRAILKKVNQLEQFRSISDPKISGLIWVQTV